MPAIRFLLFCVLIFSSAIVLSQENKSLNFCGKHSVYFDPVRCPDDVGLNNLWLGAGYRYGLTEKLQLDFSAGVIVYSTDNDNESWFAVNTKRSNGFYASGEISRFYKKERFYTSFNLNYRYTFTTRNDYSTGQFFPGHEWYFTPSDYWVTRHVISAYPKIGWTIPVFGKWQFIDFSFGYGLKFISSHNSIVNGFANGDTELFTGKIYDRGNKLVAYPTMSLKFMHTFNYGNPRHPKGH
jgi:hypothetical protein